MDCSEEVIDQERVGRKKERRMIQGASCPGVSMKPRQRQDAVVRRADRDSELQSRKPPGSHMPGSHDMAVLYVMLALMPVLISLLLEPLHLPHPFLLDSNTAQYSPPRILLLTAHPDDEAFFFGPTLTSLIPSLPAPVSESSGEKASDNVALTLPQVYSLCLSVGNADGLGNIRRDELGDSLDILGVAEDRRWILDKSYVSYLCLVLSDTDSSQR